MSPAPWSAERTRRRIALDQADSWADEWDRIKVKVPRNARRDHPTFKILLGWLDRVPYLALLRRERERERLGPA